MHLPEVQMVGLQVVESGGQVILGFLPGAAVGLAGEENPVPVPVEAVSQIGLAAGISPGAFKIGDARFQGGFDHGLSLPFVAEGAEHPFAPQSQDGDGDPGASQDPLRQRHDSLLDGRFFEERGRELPKQNLPGAAVPRLIAVNSAYFI
jgi:hypothetical protein